MNGYAAWSSSRKRNAQFARICSDLVEERSGWRGRPVGIPEIRTRGRIEQRRAVSHCSGDCMFGYQAGEHIPEIRTERIARARGFQTEQPAARSRNANRAAAIIGVRKRNQSGGYSGAGWEGIRCTNNRITSA